MLRLLALLVFCLASVNSAFLGAKECSYGPSFWCASLKNAKSCSAVQHCISSVWEKQILPNDDGSICGICKDMVSQAREQLESKQSQELLKQVFEGSCKLLPITDLQNECITYVDEFIPELIETLASQMNPQVVCATVGLCNSARINMMLEKHEVLSKIDMKTNAPESHNCADCQTFIDDIKKMALSYSRSELLQKMMQVCGRLSSLADGCKAIVEVNFPAIYDYVQNQLNSKEACDLFGFCDRIYGGVQTKLSHRTGDEICDFCESMVQHYKDTLAANTSRAQFKEILDGMCQSTGHFKQECLSLVNQYFDMIYDLLVSEVDPQKVCESVGLCGASSVFRNDFATWTLFDMRPANHLPLIPLEENSIGNNDFNIMIPRPVPLKKHDVISISMANTGLRVPKHKPKIDNECMMCEFVLHFLQQYLEEKPSQEAVKTALDHVCNLLPHTVAEQCQDYVDAYGDQVLQLIIFEMDPSTLCPELHMCPSETMQLFSLPAFTKNSLCVVCEFVLTLAEELLSNNVMYIENSMKVVCHIFPSSVRSQCDSFVDEYGQAIINYLEQGASPKRVCSILSLCEPGKTFTGPNFALELLNEIQEPKSLNGPNYATHLLKNIQQRIPKKTEVAFTQSTGCVLCEFIMRELDHFLIFPSTTAKIESAVDRVCLVLPSNLQTDCLSFLEKYTTQLIELLVSQMEPTLVCVHSGICEQKITKELPTSPVSFPKRGLLGKKKCTWGPAYWCKSEKHAANCNATQHCVDNVWKNGKP